MQLDIFNSVSPAQSLVPQLFTTTADGSGVDTANFHGAVAILDIGTFGGSGALAATVQLQDSADNSTFAAVAAAFIQGGQPAEIDVNNDVAILKRGYLGNKRYLRWSVTAIAGTSPSLPLSGTIIRTNPRKAKV